ncbi:PKD domain-containing protein [Winogradskyella psychrotolerans]|uniref:PKD domain-containing protein n=1 Tax=Winogradskyella psychrotolerans TaxID=1344585 RepID=UPI001C068F67|nr:PKD domain-containing protein [Winogradskyella psychrotolerans]MBU2929407.1 PKD domain-containing protein [Winogradskyella psychrotolerans]
MGKIKFRLLTVVGLAFGIIGAVNISDIALFNKNRLEITDVKSVRMAPNATIAGTTTVCHNESPQPEITFTGSAGSAPYTFTYTINGGSNQTITTGGTDTSVSISVNTNVIGSFVYELVSVRDSSNTTSPANGSATVTVAAPPTVNFTFNDDTCSGTPVNFSSTVTGNGPFTYDWEFGDSSSSTNENPSHSYDAFGCGFSNFSVTLTVTDSNGCTKTRTKPISIKQRPNLSFEDLNAQFLPFDNCGNNTVDPTYTVDVGNVSPSDSCVTSYDINWGDGSSETNITFPITHTYNVLGSFDMVITGYGTNGCITNDTYLVKNSSNPGGNVSNPGNTTNLCLPVDDLGFTIADWGENPQDTTYFVDYGDGTQETFTQGNLIAASLDYDPANPSAASPFPLNHIYTESSCPNPGYIISLNISTSCGNTISTAGPITLLSLPEVDFEFETPGCLNTEIQFTNTTENGYGPNCTEQANHVWDFGDGNTSDLESPTHTYTSPGTYTVTLTEENFCGATPPVSKTICIEPELVPSFSLSDTSGCIPFDLNISNTTDLSQSCGSDTYLWEVIYTSEFCGTSESYNFTGGTDENSENPSIQFDTAGTYEIVMTATNSCGDFQTSQFIEVKRPPTVTLDPIEDACGSLTFNPVATVETCAPASDTITYSWLFPGGSPATSDQLDPGTISYTTVGDYTVTFSITNSCGTTTETETFSINDSPTITNTDLVQTICSGASTAAILITSDDPSTTFNWTSNNPVGLSGYAPSGIGSTIPVQTIINTTTSPITLIYTVTPEIDGCEGLPFDFEIIVEPAPLITVQPISNGVCQNGTTDDLSVAYQGTGTPVYQWYENTVNDTSSGTAIAGATSATFSPPTDTVGITYYYVIITFSSGGCNEIISDTAEIEVANAPQIDTQPISTQSICIGGNSEELEVIISGGSGTATYQWFSNTINSNSGGTLISGATASTYTPPVFNTIGTFYYYVEVSFVSNGCSMLISDVSEIEVVDDPEITIEPLDFQSLCQNSAVEDLEVVVSGGLGNLSYQWYVNTANNTTSGTVIAGATSNIYTPPGSAVGTLFYYCIITQDVSGCEVISAIAEVEISAGAQFSAQPILDELCLGETTPALTVAYTNGTGTATYQWYQNIDDNTLTGTAIPGATTNTYNPNVDTVGSMHYYAIITFSSGGCTEIISETAEIIVNETPLIANSEVLICSGNTFVFLPDTSDTVPLNTVYTWTTPVVSPIGSITGATEQLTPIATVSQFLENTTTTPATVTYTVTPVSGNCPGLPFEVEVIVNPSISVMSTETHNLCYQVNTGSIEIVIVGGIPFSTGSDYNITWTGPNGFSSTDQDIFNLEAGDYTLDIEDDGGCPYSEIITITEPDELVFSAIDFDVETISCFGANDGEIGIDVSGGTPPYVYTWTLNGSPFSTDEDVSNIGPGDYNISVTDANSCGPIEYDFTFEEPAELEVTLDAKTDVLCYGDATGIIAVNVIGGRTDYNYVWSGPNGFSSTNQNIDTLIAGTYNLTVTDRSGCIDTLEVEILENDQIEIDLTVTQMVCYGDNDGSIVINSISGGVAPYTIAWSNLGTGNSQTNLSGGTYTITITDAENCERQFPVVIDEPPVFLIDPVVTQMTCAGENDGSITLNFVGGVDPVNLVWDDDATAGTERNNLAPGMYTVTITDGVPCEIQESFTIFDILPLELSATLTNALDCEDPNSGAINLLIQGGTPPFDVLWSNGEVTEDLSAIPPNTYVAAVTDANGCTIEGSWEVTRFEPLVLHVEEEVDVNCDTKTINQTFIAMASGGVPPFQYNWSSGTVSGVNNEFMTTDANGLVILEVTDSFGCSINYTFNVELTTLGDADFDTTSYGYLNYGIYAIQDPIEFINEATGHYETILWDFGDGSFSGEENPIHTYFTPGSYEVKQTVTYPYGCVYEKSITLSIEEGYKLIMPDAFTPNGDGVNDFFGPVFIGLNSLEMNVYDTWGSLIYNETGDAIRGWDGKVKDEEAENGNYYYTFTAKTFYGNEIKKQGAFVFIR